MSTEIITIIIIIIRKILTDTLRITIHLKKILREKKKKIINVLTVFFIFYKSDVNTFLK